MSNLLSIKIKKILKNQKGHTFLELIVVISIFAIMSSVLLFNFGDFSTNIAVQNLAADIALTIKQAQSEAISGRSNALYGTNSVSAPTYGVAFDTNHPSSFAYFVDVDLNHDRVMNTAGSQDWECGDPSSECLREISILTGDTIASEGLCIDGSCGFTDLSITFQRPFPDAVIKSASAFGLNGTTAEVTVISARGMQKIIKVNSLGQISVE